LLEAMGKKNYGSLLAQITRSRMRKVELSLIDQACKLLKSMRPPEGTYLTHKELGSLMKWKRVTCPCGATDSRMEPCKASGACPCNAGSAEAGEACDIRNGSVQEILEGIAPKSESADKWLFQALVRAAMHAPEGCVWKAGGKFILSNEERNQSIKGIVSILERNEPESDAGKGIRALVEHTEKEYGFRISAVQLNFHPNNKTFHRQHRDIYGASQKGGLNCTCKFTRAVGTVCYSIGSSREVLTETMTDKKSKYKACGDDCTGSKTYRWMHSGSAMYFNAPWNGNHTHGIPPLEEACGPRISIALLCA
jgi:hypothetical protein